MKRLLFVEDDDMSRDVISTRLTRSGYEVVVVEDGHKALHAITNQAFDLIILDMSMPGLSGWETAKRLKASPATASIPILALSAHAMSADKKKALDAGCGDFDSKPVVLPRLVGKIQKLLGEEPENKDT
ncbi:MAG: response regulator [Methylacidiphilales bacterium]|nr:response regulator [Candidatus Methylacidiphilales bacterium]